MAVCSAGDVVSLPAALRVLLPLANDWQTIGTLKGIAPEVLENIRTREKEVPVNCLRAMLEKMIKLTDPAPTWKALAEAVAPIDQDKAKEIRDNYVGGAQVAAKKGGGGPISSPPAGKTAMSRLKEYCDRNKLPEPMYKDVSKVTSGGSGEQRFQFEVTFTTRAKGNECGSKSDARHSAAQKAMERLGKN